MSFFPDVDTIRYQGPESTDPLAFRYYDANAEVLGKTMKEHLRFAVCYWHSFDAPGSDVFGDGTWDRPWANGAADPMVAAREKLAAGFEFISKLTAPYFCFHDRDVAPEGATLAETERNLLAIGDSNSSAKERNQVVPGSEKATAAASRESPETDVAKLEDLAVLEKEFPFFGEEETETGEIDLGHIRFYLGKIGVDGQIHG